MTAATPETRQLARDLHAALRAAFPDTHIRVTAGHSRYGDYTTLRWQDGPAAGAVAAVCQPIALERGMGGVMVEYSRCYSLAMLQKAARVWAQVYQHEEPEIVVPHRGHPWPRIEEPGLRSQFWSVAAALSEAAGAGQGEAA